jgi:thioredoxin-like negative regulator of GroEL
MPVPEEASTMEQQLETLRARLDQAIKIGEVSTSERVRLAVSNQRCRTAMLRAARYLVSGRVEEALTVIIKELRRQRWLD